MILSDKGSAYAEIKIPYLSRKKGIKMKDISGISYTLDSSGSIVSQKIDRKQIFREKVDEDLRKLSFTFPGIKLGSVIEYRYTKIETNCFEENKITLFACHLYHRHNHLFHTYPPMLKSIAVIIYIVIVIIGIAEKPIFPGKNEG